ncbi:MBL fold metallo-hydrolase [bacterium]|nr:MBL fold metallo-hydrolase [bacterium]
MSHSSTRLLFLGTSSVVPEPGRDTASVLVRGNILIDTGWHCVANIQRHGHDPLDVTAVFLTHLHQDHYLGLPQLLFYARMKRSDRTILLAGPRENLQDAFDRIRQFLYVDRSPEVEPKVQLMPLSSGDSLDVEGFHVEACAAAHNIPALAYRFTNQRTGTTFVYSGDTAPTETITDLARGADLLVHEASKGDSENGSPFHSSARDAARTADKAGVGRLALTHIGLTRRATALAAARRIFAETILPEEGDRIEATR